MSKIKLTLIAMLIVLGVAISLVGILGAPPNNFPINKIVSVVKGSNAREIMAELEDQSVIRSAPFGTMILSLGGLGQRVVDGEYVFDSPISIFEIINRITGGHFGPSRIRLVIPEGSSNRAIAKIIEKKVPDFNSKAFIELARDSEGYLFPDTYFVFGNSITPTSVIQMMRTNFDRQVERAGFDASNEKKFHRYVIIASLLEREATNGKDAEIIAGIINNRLKKNMPLQLDATLTYLLGKGSAQLTRAELRMKSPYNTYVHKGLPPGPIGNPGIVMLRAAMNPKPNSYLFYLHDPFGFPHYSLNYAEHLRNKRKHIDSY